MEKDIDLALRKIMKWLKQNRNPHCKFLIDSHSAELLSGDMCITNGYEQKTCSVCHKEIDLDNLVMCYDESLNEVFFCFNCFAQTQIA